ncbi:MAG: hypothetical protein JO238_02725 [Alphaproteobacteria bacterium]|nr:hypothetical protein [Alphaproteobacteria bacterium]
MEPLRRRRQQQLQLELEQLQLRCEQLQRELQLQQLELQQLQLQLQQLQLELQQLQQLELLLLRLTGPKGAAPPGGRAGGERFQRR